MKHPATVSPAAPRVAAGDAIDETRAKAGPAKPPISIVGHRRST